MFVDVDPDFGPLPRTMNAQVTWLVTDTDVQLDFSEQVHLSINPAHTAWEGTTTRDELSTTISVYATVDPEVFTITATLHTNGTPLRSISFTHTQSPGDRRWDTGLLERIDQPGINETALRLLA